MTKLWSGRFDKSTAKDLELFSESISFDKRLYKADIQGSLAHAQMLKEINILTEDELVSIKNSLKLVEKEIEDGKFDFNIKFEDIHMAIESRLIDLSGEAGKKIHTARSRNDQVALDTRLYVISSINELKEIIVEFQKTIVNLSEQNVETIMPGYTHLQRAQVISLAHHLLTYYCMFKRDLSRLSDLKARIKAEMPLGSGALAGSTINIDRKLTCDLLGFTDVSLISLDSVSDRDYIIEFNSICSLIMIHLSRLSEELIIWNTKEFSFIEIADDYATGSSMMPQKKNPDIPELVRGKSSRVIGNLVQILTLVKGTPLSYNRDFQEDKESLFDTFDTASNSLSIMCNLLNNITFNKEKMRLATIDGFMNATEAMEYLIKKGIPNRDAHHIIGKAVAYCISSNCNLEDLSIDQWIDIDNRLKGLISSDISNILLVDSCLLARKSYGGPSPDYIRTAIDKIKKEIN